MAKKETGKYVIISSTRTITVTPSIQYLNLTDENSSAENRIRVRPLWYKAAIKIKKGRGFYPAEIVEWNTVKSLAESGIFTIGSFTDNADETGELLTKEFELAKKTIELEKAKNTKKFVSLGEVAADDTSSK